MTKKYNKNSTIYKFVEFFYYFFRVNVELLYTFLL